jgi:hypothetical protein
VRVLALLSLIPGFVLLTMGAVYLFVGTGQLERIYAGLFILWAVGWFLAWFALEVRYG